MTEKELSADIKKELNHQLEILQRGVVDLLPFDEFKSKLIRSITENKPLRVKQGFDPTAPDIHLGHTVGMLKLKQFQELGHKIVLIVGDYTAMIGDPSGQSATRPHLEYDDIMKNAETYQDQFFKILDRDKTEIRFNGDWFKKMDFLEIMNLATRITVARLLERDDFEKRLKNQTPISLHELFYPLMQAYDSVAIDADIELGATEQTFNLLAGRAIQESFGKEPQCILTMPILVGLDGSKKMSKSLGNYIGIDEPPKEIFGKVMSIPDDLIYSYFELSTDLPVERLKEYKALLEDDKLNPMDTKKELGITLVDMYHSQGSGKLAKEEFERIFSQKKLPDEIPEITKAEIVALELNPEKIYLVHLMTKTKLAKSNGEARKLIQGGGVSIDNEKIDDPNFEFELKNGQILKVGKRRFLKLLSA